MKHRMLGGITGIALSVTSPIIKQAVKAISTAIGRWIKNFIMLFSVFIVCSQSFTAYSHLRFMR